MMRRTLILVSCFAIEAIAAPAVAQDITSNLGAHWRLVETSGAIAVDSSSTANNGTYLNGVTLANSTPNPIDGAVAARFDGSNDYVAIPNEAFYDTVGATTVATWIKVNAWTVADQAIVTKGDAASARLIRDGSNNGVAFVCRGLTTIRVASTVNVNDGKWHHIAGVFTGSQLRIYVDGMLSNSVGSVGFISTNNFPLQIGSNAEVAGKNFNGWIYDVRLYSRALSAADISYLCLKGAPVGQWKLSETSGTTAADSSLYARNGTLSGAVTWSTRCNGTGVFDFNGSSDNISITNATQLQPTAALTIAAWIRGDSWGAGTDNDTILRKGEDNPNNYALAVSAGRVELLLDGNDSTGFRGNTVLSTGEWYHVAATWDGANVRIYVNGVLDNTPAARAGTILTDTRALYIGGRPAADYFDGTMQEVILYNRALTPAEIARLAGNAGYWRFSEGSGTTAADTSGVGNNATLSGGATWTTDCAGNNNALSTNGAGAIAQTAAAFTPPDLGTVAFWMRSNGNPAALGRIFGLGGDWEARQMTDGTVVFDLCGEGGTSFATTMPLNVVGQWYHVAATFDSATDAYAIYIDGQLHTSGTNTSAMTQQAAAVLSFGTRTGSTEYWQGALRDFRVYSRKLCPTEIAQLYGLIGHWKLDETSGTAAADSSMLGNSGAVSGTVAWTSGAVDGAHQFNYTDGDDYVTMPNSTILDNVQEGSFSLAAWFKPLSTPPGSGSDNSASYAIIQKPGRHTGLSYANSNRFQFDHRIAPNSWIGAVSTITHPPGTFYHVAVVLNRPAGTINLYVDGNLVETETFTPNTAAIEYGTARWRIGSTDPTYGTWRWPAHGVIDDVRIYNRSICPAEIQTLYDAGYSFGGVKIIKWIEIQ